MQEDRPNARTIGPLDQFKFAFYASKDTRLSACDLACLMEITDRFIKKDFGQHKAGVTFPTGHTHLVRETGYAITAVKASLSRLISFGYISVAVEGKGTRGSEYVPNFNWSRTVLIAVDQETKARAAAKKKRHRSASGSVERPTSTSTPVGRSSDPLRDIVGRHTDLLTCVVGQSAVPQTYMGPKCPYMGGDTAPPDCFGQPVGGAPEERKIKTAFPESEDGEKWISLTFEDGGCDTIATESNDQHIQDDGQRELQRLCASAGLDEVNDTSELIGRTVYVQAGRYVPAPAPANDDWPEWMDSEYEEDDAA